jgi:hypothetical protein
MKKMIRNLLPNHFYSWLLLLIKKVNVIGAKKAKGKYLLFLDANYIIQSSLLTQFLQPLEEIIVS